MLKSEPKANPSRQGKNVRLAKRGNSGSLERTCELGYSPITLIPKDGGQSIALEKASEAPDHTARVPWQL